MTVHTLQGFSLFSELGVVAAEHFLIQTQILFSLCQISGLLHFCHISSVERFSLSLPPSCIHQSRCSYSQYTTLVCIYMRSIAVPVLLVFTVSIFSRQIALCFSPTVFSCLLTFSGSHGIFSFGPCLAVCNGFLRSLFFIHFHV